MKKKLLFVSGVGRSGTSALVNVLNNNPVALIGQERYFWTIRKDLIAPEHFEKHRFLDIREEDTHNKSAFRGKPEELSARYDAATLIGDKFPSLFRHFDRIFDIFPEAQHLYIVRNPLSVLESYDARYTNSSDSWSHSYQDGMDAWNESVGKVASLPEHLRKKFTIVRYEDLYNSTEAINTMFADLGLPEVENARLQPFVDKFRGLNNQNVPRRDNLRFFVARNADWDSYGKLCDLIDGRSATPVD